MAGREGSMTRLVNGDGRREDSTDQLDPRSELVKSAGSGGSLSFGSTVAARIRPGVPGSRAKLVTDRFGPGRISPAIPAQLPPASVLGGSRPPAGHRGARPRST